MRIHHFYPRTRNIGDHFVQKGVERMIRRIIPQATFDLFNVNSRGAEKGDYGLTRAAIERANRAADLIIVGGSNLYEGSYRWPWGVHLEVEALRHLRVPLFLLGIGTGSDFLSRPHRPSPRAAAEIRRLNECATFSGARDLLTYDWLRRLGIANVELTGDPATFIFNHPLQTKRDGHLLLALPPRRFWSGKRQFWKVQAQGRAMFKALIALTRTLSARGQPVVVACNDPADWQLARSLFEGLLPERVFCPQSPEEYFQLLAQARAVVTGRLHTAVVSFSLGIPFVLLNSDQRTHGFAETYQLGKWALLPSWRGLEAQLQELTDLLLGDEAMLSWEALLQQRDRMHTRAMQLLQAALKSIA